MTRNLSSWLFSAFLATLVAFCSACGGPSFLENARGGVVDLSGQWQLTEKPETRVTAWLNQLSKNQEKRWRRDAKRMRDGADDDVFADAPGTSSPEGPPGQFSNLQWMREQDRREILAITEWLAPAADLDIKQTSQLLEIRSTKQGTRHFTATESSSLFQSIGTFVVSSGWVENSYVIRSVGSGENRLSLVETYTLRAAGKQLESRIEASVPMLGRQTFAFVYERKQ